jgi:hypothetical protein
MTQPRLKLEVYHTWNFLRIYIHCSYVVDDKELIKEVLSIQLYHDENKLILNETMRSSLY